MNIERSDPNLLFSHPLLGKTFPGFPDPFCRLPSTKYPHRMPHIRPIFLSWICLLIGVLAGPAQDFKAMRKTMVQEQLADRGILTVNVLEAMRNVERHRFVPKELLSHA